jgi:cation diffusion facilitator CzcD-associated flavoprotein CzcO
MRANALAAEFVRRKIREIVENPETAALLSPSQPIGCKRLAVDANGYYEAFNRRNVKLVDVSKQPIDAVTPRGLVTGGREYEFDALIFATGFDAFTGPLTRPDLRGRNGLSMRDKWRDGPLNYLGLMIAGFPNLFNIAGPGSTSAFTNVIVSIEHHIDWIADCIAWLDANGHQTIEPSEEAEARWMAFVYEVATHTVFLNCNSWYLGANIPGKPRVFMPMAMGYPAYAERCAAVAAKGYEGFIVA